MTCVRLWRSAWRLSCCSFLCDITGMYNEHPIHPSTPLSSKKTPTSNTTVHEQPGLPFHTSERNYRGVSGAGGRGRPGSQGQISEFVLLWIPLGSRISELMVKLRFTAPGSVGKLRFSGLAIVSTRAQPSILAGSDPKPEITRSDFLNPLGKNSHPCSATILDQGRSHSGFIL